MDILQGLEYDLADLTPRRFIRHAVTKEFLKRSLPHLTVPTLVDLHPSLANLDHLNAFIKQAQKIHHPEGTGWRGESFFIFHLCWSSS